MTTEREREGERGVEARQERRGEGDNERTADGGTID